MPAVSSDPQAQSPQRSGVVVPQKPKWHQRLAAALIYGLIRAVSATIRYEWRDSSGLLSIDRDQSVIFAIWHNRLSLCLEVYRVFLRNIQRPCKMAAMVSASKDGGLLARVLELYGVQPVRGSTSRRGRQALLELVGWAERGHDLAITPDGPRGPRCIIQEGVIALAQLTGLPILPVSYHLTWKITLKSWDRFQIPLPFTKCLMHFTRPIYVPREISEEQREQLRRQVEDQLKAVTDDL
jgi:lysophospholipid acyltransferase (LPLAT)-like uncharacterized protein